MHPSKFPTPCSEKQCIITKAWAKPWMFETLSTTPQRLHFPRMRIASCLTFSYLIYAGSTWVIIGKKLAQSFYLSHESNPASLICKIIALPTTPQGRYFLFIYWLWGCLDIWFYNVWESFSSFYKLFLVNLFNRKLSSSDKESFVLFCLCTVFVFCILYTCFPFHVLYKSLHLFLFVAWIRMILSVLVLLSRSAVFLPCTQDIFHQLCS